MPRKVKNGIEIALASSVLWYDKLEFESFFEVIDSILSEQNIVIDGTFLVFVNLLKKILSDEGMNLDDFSVPQERREALVGKLLMYNQCRPNSDEVSLFELWLQKVLETDTPMELSEDILNHFVWEEFKKSIEAIDKSDISFADKLSVRPKMLGLQKSDGEGLVYLDDIYYDEDKDEIEKSRFTTGKSEFDSYIELERGQFVVIAARPSVGKSLFMLQMAMANAKNGVKSLFVSLEMNKRKLNDRIINYHTGENVKDRFKDEKGFLDVKGYNNALDEVRRMRSYKPIGKNLQLYYTEKRNAEAVLQEIEEMIKKNQYSAIFLDYLQLMRYSGLDEWASLRAITNDLKRLAMRTQTLLVSGSQVSRSSTERGLYLSDLFGSSTIEADTDIVIGLEQVRERKQGEKCLINVKTLKDRDGDLPEQRYIVDYSNGRMYKSE